MFICFTFLAICTIGCEIKRYETFEEALSAEKSPRLSMKQKQWLLGLPAIIMEVNRSSHKTLETEPFSDKATLNYKHILKKWWRINDRNELLESIKKLEKHGHNETYLKLCDILKNSPEEELKSIIQKYNLSDKEANYYIFLKNNYTVAVAVNIVSWDLGRAASLIRWGYQVGYLSEAEAWNLLLFIGFKIQEQYDSWLEYGTAYACGRVFWASGFGKGEKYYWETKKVLDDLLLNGGLWEELEWEEKF